jgi:hypothetical protein
MSQVVRCPTSELTRFRFFVQLSIESRSSRSRLRDTHTGLVEMKEEKMMSDSCVICLFLQMRELEDLYCDVEAGFVECMELSVVRVWLDSAYDKWDKMFPKKSTRCAIEAVSSLIY